jgi:hypothetical protein
MENYTIVSDSTTCTTCTKPYVGIAEAERLARISQTNDDADGNVSDADSVEDFTWSNTQSNTSRTEASGSNTRTSHTRSASTSLQTPAGSGTGTTPSSLSRAHRSSTRNQTDSASTSQPTPAGSGTDPTQRDTALSGSSPKLGRSGMPRLRLSTD